MLARRALKKYCWIDESSSGETKEWRVDESRRKKKTETIDDYISVDLERRSFLTKETIRRNEKTTHAPELLVVVSTSTVRIVLLAHSIFSRVAHILKQTCLSGTGASGAVAEFVFVKRTCLRGKNHR